MKQESILQNIYCKKNSCRIISACIFGMVDKMYHYIGAPGTREDGIRRNQELRQSCSQHPCFQDVKNDITRGQEILLRKK